MVGIQVYQYILAMYACMSVRMYVHTCVCVCVCVCVYVCVYKPHRQGDGNGKGIPTNGLV